MYLSKRLRTIALLALATVALQGQGEQSITLPKGYELEAIRPGKVYLLAGEGGSRGGGANSTILIGTSGVVIVDPKVDMEAGSEIVKVAASLTSKPITHLIETHSDCDHVNGVVAFPTSVKVMAHLNNFIEQEQTMRFATVEYNGGSGTPPPDRMPTMLINQEKTDTHIDGIHLIMYHWAPAHTSGDLIVYLPDEKVVVAGDLLLNPTPGPHGLPPQQHGMWWKFEKNGSIAGWFKNIDGLLGLNADVYIPGHGDQPFTRADVRELRVGLQADKDKLDAMADAGKSLEEIQTAFNDQAYPARSSMAPNSPRVNCPRGIGYMPFTWLEYHEWLNKHNEFKG